MGAHTIGIGSNCEICLYSGDFARPKIVYQELARTGNAFAIETEGMFVGNSAYLLTVSGDSLDELHYVCALLNSRLVLYYLDKQTTRFDDNGWRWLRQFVEGLRLPRFASMRRILNLDWQVEQNKTEENIAQLNAAVYDIFDLSDSERKYVDDYLAGY